MTRLELHPFDPELLDEAAGLLARRHAAQRAVEPGLPAAYEQLEVARGAIAELATGDASGAVASRGGAVVGYLLGTPRESPIWGPNVWVEPAGHAVDEAEVVRDLYAFAAGRWVDEGRTSHYAVVPATDPKLVDAWFRLGFGQQHVHAIREAPESPLTESLPGVVIRRADPRRHRRPRRARAGTPGPSGALTGLLGRAAAAVRGGEGRMGGGLRQPGVRHLRGGAGRPRGRLRSRLLGAESSLHTGIARPDDAAHLGFAAVLEDARGAGVGKALGTTVLDWATAEGYRAVVTDWRATNLLSSRTWPQLGWRPTFLRLFRAIA